MGTHILQGRTGRGLRSSQALTVLLAYWIEEALVTIRRKLEGASGSKRLARVYCEGLEDGWVDGFVVKTGSEFFCMHVLDKGVRLDGYNCMRYADVTSCKLPAPDSRFQKRALRLRGMSRTDPPVEMSSAASIVRTAGEKYPLVTVHLEQSDPGVCYIGAVQRVTRSRVRLRLIGPGAQWEEGSASFVLGHISRVDFGCSYEEALILVAANEGAVQHGH